MNGTIQSVKDDRGFGFIDGADGTRYFFHRSALRGLLFEDLELGQSVTFRVELAPKGPRAEDVRVA